MRISDLGERELLALAISSEEEDGRLYRDIAEFVRDDYPDTARVFADMADAENDHRRQLIDLFRRSPHESWRGSTPARRTPTARTG